MPRRQDVTGAYAGAAGLMGETQLSRHCRAEFVPRDRICTAARLADGAGQGAGGGGVEALLHAAGEVGFAAGGGGFAHGLGH